jgi:orotate phosphoribosyltransferase
MQREQEAGLILAQVNAVLTDSHFVYTSGKHGNSYVNKDAIYPHTKLTARLCEMMAESFKHDGVDVVIAPAVGGVILSHEVALHLSQMCGHEVFGIYADKRKEDDGFEIKRGYDKLIIGKNVLVVEDNLTTGGSVKKVVEAVRAGGGKVVGVAAICNRGQVTVHDVGNVPRLDALVNVKLDAYDEDKCPLCAAHMPINTAIGKGKEFLARKRA